VGHPQVWPVGQTLRKRLNQTNAYAVGNTYSEQIEDYRLLSITSSIQGLCRSLTLEKRNDLKRDSICLQL